MKFESSQEGQFKKSAQGNLRGFLLSVILSLPKHAFYLSVGAIFLL
jgi:hypothetical protein